MQKNSIQLFLGIMFACFVVVFCFLHPPDFRNQNISQDQFTMRMKDKVNTFAKQNPDTLYNVTISFKKYLHYSEVQKIADTFDINSGVSVFYAVHGFKGPPPLSSGKTLSEQFQNLKKNLIEDYSRKNYAGHINEAFVVKELQEDKLYIGNITFRISPKLAKKIWERKAQIVRFVEIMDNPDLSVGGFPPERDSSVSGIADADEHIAKCEQAPHPSIPWPSIPPNCK